MATLSSCCNNYKNITSFYYIGTKHKLVLLLLFVFLREFFFTKNKTHPFLPTFSHHLFSLTHALFLLNTNGFACLIVFVFQSIRCLLWFASFRHCAPRNISSIAKHRGPPSSARSGRSTSREYTRAHQSAYGPIAYCCLLLRSNLARLLCLRFCSLFWTRRVSSRCGELWGHAYAMRGVFVSWFKLSFVAVACVE